MTTQPPEASASYDPPLEREATNAHSLDFWLILILGICSPIMLGISLSVINPESGPLANFKVLLVTISAGFVAYGVNRFALDRGAPLAAIGFRWAMAVSLLSMSVVGGGMFIGSFTGIVYHAVVARQLEDNGAGLARFVSHTHQTTVEARKSGPVLRLVSQDLARLATCERTASCLSRASSGGYCLLYTSPSPRDKRQSRMPSSA